MDVRIDTLKRATWERLCDTVAAPLQQRWAYGETVKRLGGTVSRVGVFKGTTPIALAQFLIRTSILKVGLLSRGPVWIGDVRKSQQDAAYHAIRQMLRREGVRCLMTTPNGSNIPPFGHPISTPATTAILSLDEDMRLALHGKWRNRLVKAGATKLRINSLAVRGTDHDWLLDNEKQQRSERGYKSLPPAFAEAWLHEPTAKSLTLIAATREPIAGMMFLCHGNTATYHLGWTNSEGREQSAHTLMLWRAMEHLHSGGVASLDLGMLDTVRTPGLARFKLGTGAKTHQLGATTLSF